MNFRPTRSLFWRVFVVNAGVFVAAALALALSPATVSSPITLQEASTLVAGICALLVVNVLLMRRSFLPLTRLARLMRRIDPLQPGQRIAISGAGREIDDLATSFNDMLGRLESERRSSGREQMEAQEAERRRISAELHDELGQRLTILLLTLDRLQRTERREARAEDLRASRELTQTTITDLRHLAQGLRPEELDELGLAPALSALASRIAERTGVRVYRSLMPLPFRPDPAIELVAYRIAQEALTNAARHGGKAVHLTLACDLEAHDLLLEIADDGPGLPPDAETQKGLGLRTMRERALLVGASLELHGNRGGTSVRLIIPLPGQE